MEAAQSDLWEQASSAATVYFRNRRLRRPDSQAFDRLRVGAGISFLALCFGGPQAALAAMRGSIGAAYEVAKPGLSPGEQKVGDALLPVFLDASRQPVTPAAKPGFFAPGPTAPVAPVRGFWTT